MIDDSCNHLFVYGTLKRGQRNHHLIEHLVVDIQPAKTRGVLYHLPYGYPAMFQRDEGWIYGEVFEMKDVNQAIIITDRLEGFVPDTLSSSQYFRIRQNVFTDSGEKLNSWLYIYNPRRNEILSHSLRVKSGTWPVI